MNMWFFCIVFFLTVKNSFMLARLYKEERSLLTAVKCQPCISVIMPFDPKMVSKTEIAHSLKKITDKIKYELYESRAGNIADEMLDKFKNVMEHLDYTTHKKSI